MWLRCFLNTIRLVPQGTEILFRGEKDEEMDFRKVPRKILLGRPEENDTHLVVREKARGGKRFKRALK